MVGDERYRLARGDAATAETDAPRHVQGAFPFELDQLLRAMPKSHIPLRNSHQRRETLENALKNPVFFINMA